MQLPDCIRAYFSIGLDFVGSQRTAGTRSRALSEQCSFDVRNDMAWAGGGALIQHRPRQLENLVNGQLQVSRVILESGYIGLNLIDYRGKFFPNSNRRGRKPLSSMKL